jgi:hypothetical protein
MAPKKELGSTWNRDAASPLLSAIVNFLAPALLLGLTPLFVILLWYSLRWVVKLLAPSPPPPLPF